MQEDRFVPEDKTLVHLYRLGIMRDGFASLVNLVTLAIGIAIGLLLAPRVERSVMAGQGATATGSQPQVEVGKTIEFAGQRVTGVQPAISAGDALFYRLLSHRLQSDELVVNGYDLLALQQGELNILQRFATPKEISDLIAASKAKEMFVAGTAPQPKAVVPPK